jgi:hypothetical protein
MMYKIVIMSFFFAWDDRNVCVSGDASREAFRFHTKCLSYFPIYNQTLKELDALLYNFSVSSVIKLCTGFQSYFMLTGGKMNGWTGGRKDTAIVIGIPQRWERTSRSCTIRRHKNNLELYYSRRTLLSSSSSMD